MDYFEAAKALRVVDVWQAENETGWVTPKVLYDPKLKKAPRLDGYKHFVDHGTVGTNTLRFWGEGGSVQNGTFSLAQYLVPRDTTQYKDGAFHDTRNVVFKMVPDGFACNHTGICNAPFTNGNSLGMEYESKQDGTHDILVNQYIKGALVFAHDAARYHIPDWFRISHGIIALPWGRRTDPWAGKFRIAQSWAIVEAIRADERIWALWGLSRPG